ncbi:MAG: prepilin-type N-terminal cleavage/methylation domain-containing protein, partial [Synergistaceae bacterium]|nr:prepilin-type N-terminal cleavage/methylation domain-containing protein [Synergistaceae bacterium]
GLRMRTIFSERRETKKDEETGFHAGRAGLTAGRRRGFTLIELSIAMIIGILIIGAVFMVMGQGFSVMDTNSTYSLLQNAALSSFEFLPKEIGYVDKVEIVKKAPTDSEVADNPKWHYITLVGDKVTEVRWDDDTGAVKRSPLAGSTNVISLMFAAASEVEPGQGARGVHVSIKTQGKNSTRNPVELDRSIQIRAKKGVTDGDGNPLVAGDMDAEGPVLRFSGEKAPEPRLELFAASDDTPVNFSLNMAYPFMRTWGGIVPVSSDDLPVKYDLDTQFDAVLMFDKPVVMREEPVFAWLIASADVFEDRLTNIGVSFEDFKALSSHEKSEKLLEAWEEIGDNVDKGIEKRNKWLDINELETEWNNLVFHPRRVRLGLDAANPYRIPSPVPSNYSSFITGEGYRIIEVSTAASLDSASAAVLSVDAAYRVSRSDEDNADDDPDPDGAASHPRFQWGKTVYDEITKEHDMFNDAVIIGLVRYQRQDEDEPEYLAAAFRLEEYLKDDLWDKVMDIAEALEAKDPNRLGNDEFANLHPDFANNSVVKVEKRAVDGGNTAVNYGRGKFTVAAAHSVGSRGPQMMLTLSDKYFRHLNEGLDEDLYGVTNYSLYIDKRLLTTPNSRKAVDENSKPGDFMPDGGIGILLNGSAVETVNITSNKKTAKENFSSGYMFEWDPGAEGLTMRFGYYSSTVGRPAGDGAVATVSSFFDNASWILWGVQPLYAYDAAKSWPVPGDGTIKRSLSAPAQIAFFPNARDDPKSLDLRVEDFEDHVLAPLSMIEKPVWKDEKALKALAKRWVGWGVYYRPPFLPRIDSDRKNNRDKKDDRHGAHDLNEGKSGSYGPSPIRIFSRGRDSVGLNHWNLDGNGGGTKDLWFGGSYGTTWGPSGLGSVYTFQHAQTWHLYNNMQWEWMTGKNEAGDSKEKIHTKKDFVYGGGDYRSGWRFDAEYNFSEKFGKSYIDFATTLPKEWTRRHILKLTVLEVTRDILAAEVEPEWQKTLHHRHYRNSDLGGALAALTGGDIIHKAGDMFVRAELIQLKSAVDDNATQDDRIYDSRNWVYSKPLWYGKFRGDGWRGRSDDPKDNTNWSLFKRMGMSMMHLVADPEPASGDAQSFRGIVHGETTAEQVMLKKGSDGKSIGPGRGVRVRSWKDHFRGWLFIDTPGDNFDNPRKVNYPYVLDIEKMR